MTNEQKDLHDLHTLDVIKSATYTNLAALKGLGHRRDKGQVPGQDELWAEEAQKQKIKRERVEDEGHGDPGTSQWVNFEIWQVFLDSRTAAERIGMGKESPGLWRVPRAQPHRELSNEPPLDG